MIVICLGIDTRANLVRAVFSSAQEQKQALFQKMLVLLFLLFVSCYGALEETAKQNCAVDSLHGPLGEYCQSVGFINATCVNNLCSMVTHGSIITCECYPTGCPICKWPVHCNNGELVNVPQVNLCP